VDWTSAKVGDPREDLAQCRIDLTMIHGPVTADEFLDLYQLHAPAPLGDVWFFDLLRGMSALSTFRSWLPGYHDIGLRELTEEMMEQRLRPFLQKAVDRAP
jgi:aminoglycoside phosphotransferase (APT) family kinase protein